jgi:hypothetical protein
MKLHGFGAQERYRATRATIGFRRYPCTLRELRVIRAPGCHFDLRLGGTGSSTSQGQHSRKNKVRGFM